MNSMDIKYDVAITAIGNLAKTFLANNNSAILLDEGIRPNLSDMVLEHTPGKLEEDIKKGDKLLMGGIKFAPLVIGLFWPPLIVLAYMGLVGIPMGAGDYLNVWNACRKRSVVTKLGKS